MNFSIHPTSVVSPSNGITNNATLTCPCMTTSKMHYINSNTKHLLELNAPHSRYNPIAHPARWRVNNNMHHFQILHQHLIQKEPNTSNQLSAAYFIMLEPSTTLYYQHSILLEHSNQQQNQQQQHINDVKLYWTTLQLIQMFLSDIMPVIWSSQLTLMLLTLLNQMLIAGYFQLNTNKQSKQYVKGAIILIECKSPLQHVVASSAEVKTAGVSHNAQVVALPICYMLTQIGHKQPHTPMKTDNEMSTTCVV